LVRGGTGLSAVIGDQQRTNAINLVPAATLVAPLLPIIAELLSEFALLGW
jgi:hypothetical protein